jgi:TRAP-type C4-dicarboxylate transport system permease large subunit
MSETIPPSPVLITIGSGTGVSIAALFNGGLLPALVLALALCAIVWWRYRGDDLTGVRRASWSEAGGAHPPIACLVAHSGASLPFFPW